MTRRRIALPALLTLGLSTAAVAQGVRPPDAPEGAKVALQGPTSIPSGGQVTFSGTGFEQEAGGGQVVVVKLDDDKVLGEFVSDASGAVGGTVTVTAKSGKHWLRFLAGSGGLSGRGGGGEPPARSLTADFEVTATQSSSTTPTTPVASGEPVPGSPASGTITPAGATPAPPRPVTPQAVLATGGLRLVGRTVAVRLRCPGPARCNGVTRLRTRERVRTRDDVPSRRTDLGRVPYRLAAGKTAVVRVPVAAALRRVVADRSPLRVSVRVVPVSGRARIATTTLRQG